MSITYYTLSFLYLFHSVLSLVVQCSVGVCVVIWRCSCSTNSYPNSSDTMGLCLNDSATTDAATILQYFDSEPNPSMLQEAYLGGTKCDSAQQKHVQNWTVAATLYDLRFICFGFIMSCTVMGFEPLVNQRLLPPTFPRYTKIRSRAETHLYLDTMISHMLHTCSVTELHNIHELIEFFTDFSQKSPCLLSRLVYTSFKCNASVQQSNRK